MASGPIQSPSPIQKALNYYQTPISFLFPSESDLVSSNTSRPAFFSNPQIWALRKSESPRVLPIRAKPDRTIYSPRFRKRCLRTGSWSHQIWIRTVRGSSISQSSSVSILSSRKSSSLPLTSLSMNSTSRSVSGWVACYQSIIRMKRFLCYQLICFFCNQSRKDVEGSLFVVKR